MYVYIYVYIYIYIYICIYNSIHIYACAYVCVCARARVCACTYIQHMFKLYLLNYLHMHQGSERDVFRLSFLSARMSERQAAIS